jgi:hypothetical protein
MWNDNLLKGGIIKFDCLSSLDVVGGISPATIDGDRDAAGSEGFRRKCRYTGECSGGEKSAARLQKFTSIHKKLTKYILDTSA